LLDVVDCFIVVADVVVEAVVAASGVDVVVDDVVVVGCVGDSGALVEKAVSGVCVYKNKQTTIRISTTNVQL
jgi:hypothetical protein